MREPFCRLCANPIPFGEATSARKVHSYWRHGFVHVVCYVAALDARKRLRETQKAAAAVGEGQGRLFP